MSIFYNRTADFIEITIRDGTGRLIERFKCKLGDKTASTSVMKKLREKYDFCPIITTEVNSWVDTGESI